MAQNKIGARAARSTLLITLIIIVSKLVGFVREMVFAAYFGTGAISDAYTNANSVVNILILLFSACISSTFIPIYLKTKRLEGPAAANRYANNVMTVFAVVGIAVGALGYFFAQEICELFMPTLIPTAPQGSALYLTQIEKLAQTADLARIMFPSMAFAATTGVFTSLLNANERFVPEQLTGFALSLCVILACVCFSGYGITAVAVATALTYVLQLFIVIPFLRGVYRFRPTLHSGGKVKHTVLLALPAILSMAFDEINHLVDKNIGISLGDGPNTALTYAYRIITLVLGVLVVPITTVMFSRLSEYAAEGRNKSILAATKQCLEVLSIIILPVMLLAAVQSTDVIRLLYFRGAFDEYSLELTSAAFLFYILGVLAFAWRNFLTRVFYAIQDTRAPLVIGVAAVGVNIALDIVLAGPMGVGGLTLATSIAGGVGAALMLFRLRRKLGRIGFASTAVEVCKTLVAACAGAVVAMLVSNAVGGGSATGALLLRLVLSTGAGLVAYLILVVLFRVREVNTVTNLIFGRFKRRKR